MKTKEKNHPFFKEDPLWYKDAIIYELHVRAFYDSDGDGIGDFKGLTYKLDYLQNLGVTAIWLLPFFPSPLRDDGYDIADYKRVHSNYGTLGDFKEFVKQAHSRGLRVITELVLNHTSDQHPWFQRARRAKTGSKWRDFYVWSDTWDKYKERGSFSRTLRLPIGPGILWLRLITGTDFIPTSRTLIMTVPWSGKRCSNS